jgi:hypothetical protein
MCYWSINDWSSDEHIVNSYKQCKVVNETTTAITLNIHTFHKVIVDGEKYAQLILLAKRTKELCKHLNISSQIFNENMARLLISLA